MSIPGIQRGQVIEGSWLTRVAETINNHASQFQNLKAPPDAAPADVGANRESGLEDETWTVIGSTITQVQVPIVDDQQQQIGTATVDRVLTFTVQGSISGVEILFDLTSLYP